MKIGKTCFFRYDEASKKEILASRTHAIPTFGEALFDTIEAYDPKSRKQFYGRYERYPGYDLWIESQEELEQVQAVYSEDLDAIEIHAVSGENWDVVWWTGYVTWIPQAWEQFVESHPEHYEWDLIREPLTLWERFVRKYIVSTWRNCE